MSSGFLSSGLFFACLFLLYTILFKSTIKKRRFLNSGIKTLCLAETSRWRMARKRKASKFSKTGKLVKRVKNRFQKFYYLHRPAINTFRRSLYKDRKKKGICVKCTKKSLKTSIFCALHLRKSRVYNKR